ncbi:nitronate monooxygenase [Lentibacillus sp. N15]|uniref:NAD(P)H-dependent flavin oxidoreductase n=1 Tax=Lentibacillus songyuanensis TaxID=3136161 RepID=UPI0031BB47DE
MQIKNKIAQMKESMEIPVIMAPMFIVSNPKMVISACASGIAGTFPALNARAGEILEEWMQEINADLDQIKQQRPGEKVAPWGINFIVHRSNKRYVEDLKLIEKYQPPLVITSLGDPGPVAEIVHAYDGVVFSDVINIRFAKKAIEKGADGLVLVAAGAGGHGGTYNPISFVHEVRGFFDGPLALSGGMTKGEDILVTELLGADFSYMGTRFIPAKESSAQGGYKDMIVDASIEDIVYTDAFSGVNANYLLPSITAAGLDPGNLQKKEKVDFSQLRNKEVKAWKDVWGAGQGVGSINTSQSVAQIVEELKTDYDEAIEKVSRKTSIQKQ